MTASEVKVGCATIVTVAVDAVSLGEAMAHHLGVARGRSGLDRP
jgi:4-hydroxy-2-oxoheptanedioate aldolase